MSAASRRRKAAVDPKVKAKRQKIMAAVLGVLLLGVLAFQGPRTLKMLHQKPPAQAAPPPAATTAAGTPAAPGAAPTPGSPATAGAPGSLVSAGALPNSDEAPVPLQGQLISFSRFSTKDPFVQQVGVTTATPASGSSTPESSASPAAPAPTPAPVASSGTTTVAPAGSTTAPSSGSTASTVPVSTTPESTTPASTTPASTTTTTPTQTAPAAPTTAVIAVNGTRETVDSGSDFPSDNPIFHLVSLTDGGVKIGIVGGSYASGAATIDLQVGKTVTLQNTADGTQYSIRLISTG